MYIEDIEVKNYGCIENFKYNLRKNENGDPVSTIIVGKNGTGKTLLISNIVDALVEIKRKIYPNGIFEVTTNNYFKIGTLNYINNKKNTSEVKLEFNIKNNKKISYIDIMSKNPKLALENGEIIDNEIENKNDFQKTGYSKKIDINNIETAEFESEILLYFPSDRFYRPMWYNQENYNRINYDEKRNIGKSNSNFIKLDVLENLYRWLIDCFLEQKYIHLELSQNVQDLPEERSGSINVAIDTKMQSNIKQIFNIIKKDTCRYIIPTRKRQEFRVEGKEFYLNDVSQLSTGEMFTFGLALSILKEWDLNHNDSELKDIKGCVIIDEVDIGLHIDYCYRVIPSLIKLFPKVQFIITTHSPFLLSGLKNEFQENIDIMNMPNGEILNDINAFNEMKNAYNILELETNKIIQKNKILQKENSRLQSIDNKIIIYTEGKTDVKYLKIALEKLDGYENIKSKIQYYDIEHAKNTGDSELETIYNYLQIGSDSNIKICMFDRDNEKYIIDEEFQKSGKNQVYKFNIPIPNHRHKEDLISIEHYLKDEELKTLDKDGKRIFLAKEFSDKGIFLETHGLMCRYIMNNSQKQAYHPLLIIDGNADKKVYNIDEKDKKNYALPKEKFVSNIENNIDGFNKFDFSEFSKIFDIIEKIRLDSESETQ